MSRNHTGSGKAAGWGLSVLLTLALSAAACGGSSGTKSSSAPTGGVTGSNSSASTAGVTAGSVTVALISDQTGIGATSTGDAIAGAEARIGAQNAAGGVDGRKINLVSLDSASSVSGFSIAAHEAVQLKNAFAVLPVEPWTYGAAPYLNSHGIPVVGFAEDGVEWGEQPNTNMFSTSGSFDPSFPAYATYGMFFKSIGAKKVAFLGEGTTAGSSPVTRAFLASLSAAGLDICYQDSHVPFTEMDFTTTVLPVKAAGCDAVMAGFIEAQSIALASALRAAGISASQLYFTGYDQALLDQSDARASAQGAYFTSGTLPVEVKSPAITTFENNLSHYASGYKAGSIPDLGLLQGYLAADLFIRGLQATGKNLNRVNYIKSLQQVTNYTGAGLLPNPVSFNHFGTQGNTQCSFFVRLEGSSFQYVGKVCGQRISS
jgi:branched-chain amino acid transport system substrate-binding protein